MQSMQSELALLEQWRAGNASAANTLVRSHDPALAAFFRHKTTPQDVEDLKQQVWLELSRSAPVEIRSGFRAYLFGIARHVLFRHCRRKQRFPGWDPLSSSLVDLDLPLSQQVAQLLGARDLRVSLQRLPLEDQVLLELRYLHDLSTVELADIYEIPLGTVKSRLAHARKRLEALMPHRPVRK